jgi:regulator of PEP synthase PpsR (kinase-PPPase family)
MSLPPIEIHLISDSTGDTAARVARAAQTQFSGHPTALIRHPRVTTIEGLRDAYSRVGRSHVAIFYTLVDRQLRSELADLCRRDGVAGCDLLGPALDTLAVASGREADLAPGRPIALDPDYFKRVAAMEFAVKHDDGMNGAGLPKADIVLIGVSRTGKTPLSMYLGYLGYMAANIPLVPGVKPPEELFTQVDRWKVVGLTIDAERLAQIRNRRLRAIAGRAGRGDYAELNHIFDEIDEAAAIQRRLGCPVIDVTNTAIEESAQRVIELVESRRPHRDGS